MTLGSASQGAWVHLGRAAYAVRALVAIEVAGERCPCGTSQIADETKMPRAFVEQILGELRRTGFVESRRGHGGGFRMAIAAEEVSVLDVVEALDGDPWTSGPTPASATPAAVLRVWEEARMALNNVLSRHTIAEIAALERASIYARSTTKEEG